MIKKLMQQLFLLLHIGIGAAVLSVAAAPTTPSKDLDPATLAETKITLVDLSDATQSGRTFLAGTIIDAPLPTVCALIMDFSRYPEFMPNTDQAVVVRTHTDHTVLDMRLKLPLGKIKRYQLRMQPTVTARSCRLAWTMLASKDIPTEERIADTRGSWKLSAHPSEARKTVVQYFVYSDPGPVPFGLGWIVDAMGRESLPKTLEALRRRAVNGALAK